MEKIALGVNGFDALYGGLLKGSNTLLFGPSGSGKSLLCFQYLYYGVLYENQNGLLISFQGNPRIFYWLSNTFGWDFPGLIQEGKIVVLNLDPREIEKFSPGLVKAEVLGRLSTIIDQNKVARIAIDTLDAVKMSMTPQDYRASLVYLTQGFSDLGVTTLYTVTQADVERSLMDGVIELGLRGEKRFMRVWKMPLLHSTKEVEVKISEDGMDFVI